MNCEQADQTIELVLAGDADARAAEALRAHAAACERCGPAVAEALHTASLLRQGMKAVAAATPSPGTFISSWVATSQLVARPTPAQPRSRIMRPLQMRHAGAIGGMLILVTLCAWVIAALLRPVEEKTRKNYALSTLATLQVAILHYQADWGAFPPSGDQNLVRYLDGNSENGGPAKLYFPFAAADLTPDGTFLDPWGRPYRYRVWTPAGGGMNPRAFDLWSEGPLGGAGDPQQYLTNWRDIPPPR